MPATKKMKLDKAASSSGQTSLLQKFGEAERALRPKLPPNDAYHRDYEKWGDSAWNADDIPEKHRTWDGRTATDLKTFLSIQGSARYFTAHQNWPQGKKRWCWKKFDELVDLDTRQASTWASIIAKVGVEFAAYERQKKQDSERAKAEADAAAARLIEDARERAREDASQINPSSQLLQNDTADQHEVPQVFSIVPDQVAPDHNPTDAYLHELTRLTMKEMAKDEEEEAAALQAILTGRASKRKRKETKPRKFDRSAYEGDPQFPGLEDYEIIRFVEEKLRVGYTDDSVIQGNFPSFPTPFEQSLIPPDILASHANQRLQQLLSANYWLQPTSEGLICRCCFGKESGERGLIFRNRPLKWSDLCKLSSKITAHITPNEKHKTPKHEEFHVSFTESLAQLYRTPNIVEGDRTKEDVAQRILNTGHLVRLFQILARALSLSKPLQESNFICDLLATLDSPVRAFLRQGHNLTSSTIRGHLVDCIYYRLKERIVKKIKASTFVALLCDEAEDSIKQSQVSVVFKILGSEGPEEVFWDLRRLRGAHTGDNIARLVCSMVRPLNSWSATCATSTDGGSKTDREI